jgi:putative nucleotidyltransferase with HDIG domain
MIENRPIPGEADNDFEDRKRTAKEVYFKLLNAVRDAFENIRNRRRVDVRKTKRFMQDAVDATIRDETILLGLANNKNFGEALLNHSVNVAVYAIALGRRVGVPKKDLSHLGMAGLFHDIGKTGIPLEVLNKEGKLTAEERALTRTHPILGAEILMQMKEGGELSPRLISAVFEHHLGYAQAGYPRLSRERGVTLFSRIIAVADVYDALVRPRAYNKFPYVSEKALGWMFDRGGRDFDPVLLKVFAALIGVYPLGTLVLLDTNEMGVVTGVAGEPGLLDRPRVSLIRYREGEYRKGEVVNLSELNGRTGTYRRSIVHSLDPNEYNLNVAELFL